MSKMQKVLLGFLGIVIAAAALMLFTSETLSFWLGLPYEEACTAVLKTA